MAHNHSEDILAHLFNLPAGQDANSSKFQQQYCINAGWDVNCTVCCWTYLTQARGYTPVEGDCNRVTFGEADEKWTQCYISPRQENSKHGQYKTNKDPESYGQIVAGSLIKKNSTIRLYSKHRTPEPTIIGAGINVVARVESIAVPNATNENVKGSCLSYNNATILELYRVSKSLPRLQGVCVTVPYQVEAATGKVPVTTAPIKTEITKQFHSLKLKQ